MSGYSATVSAGTALIANVQEFFSESLLTDVTLRCREEAMDRKLQFISPSPLSGEKPYSCLTFHQSFGAPGGLHQHFRTHESCHARANHGAYSIRKSNSRFAMATPLYRSDHESSGGGDEQSEISWQVIVTDVGAKPSFAEGVDVKVMPEPSGVPRMTQIHSCHQGCHYVTAMGSELVAPFILTPLLTSRLNSFRFKTYQFFSHANEGQRSCEHEACSCDSNMFNCLQSIRYDTNYFMQKVPDCLSVP